jgi:hypothetical protein
MQFPVIVKFPVCAFLTPSAPVPPMQFPVIINTPALLSLAPFANATVPHIQFPVIVSVPVPANLAPSALELVPPVQSPTIAAEFPAEPEYVTQTAPEAEPANTFAVSVTPFDRVKPPPAVALLALSLRTSPTVVLTFTVMAKLFECSTSAVVNVLQTSDAVPVGVVAQTSVALMFPAFLAK